MQKLLAFVLKSYSRDFHHTQRTLISFFFQMYPPKKRRTNQIESEPETEIETETETET